MATGSRIAWSTFFAGWFLASVAGQKLWRAQRTRSKWDRLHMMLPDWRFFAPDPGVYDHHILVRVTSESGLKSSWKEITDVGERRLRHTLWHPEQRKEKAVFDVCAELFRYVERSRAEGSERTDFEKRVQMSVAYLTLLSYASARAAITGPFDDLERRVQFMITISGGYDEEQPEMVFVSEQHPLRQLE